MQRKPVIAGNWKMNLTLPAAVELIRGIGKELKRGELEAVEVAVCPPFTALNAAAGALAGTGMRLGAQNMHWEAAGAYTGEVSAPMLRDLCCDYVILGHSERRMYFGETDVNINRKVRAALDAGLTPIVCVGETLAERQTDRTEAVVSAQVQGSLMGLGAELTGVVVAYEPVWAIGTGLTASPDQAQGVHALIRRVLSQLSDVGTSGRVRIQYGGSMKPENAAELLAKPDIDGGLIGGAALQAESFAAIVRAAI